MSRIVETLRNSFGFDNSTTFPHSNKLYQPEDGHNFFHSRIILIGRFIWLSAKLTLLYCVSEKNENVSHMLSGRDRFSFKVRHRREPFFCLFWNEMF